jgi:hypothetical protein
MVELINDESNGELTKERFLEPKPLAKLAFIPNPGGKTRIVYILN